MDAESGGASDDELGVGMTREQLGEGLDELQDAFFLVETSDEEDGFGFASFFYWIEELGVDAVKNHFGFGGEGRAAGGEAVAQECAADCQAVEFGSQGVEHGCGPMTEMVVL